jgi:hypothetical protein
MEILRGTLREVVSMLPDEADIKAVVPIRYTVGSLDAIYDVVFVIPAVTVPEEAVRVPVPSTRPRPAPTRSPHKASPVARKPVRAQRVQSAS